MTNPKPTINKIEALAWMNKAAAEARKESAAEIARLREELARAAVREGEPLFSVGQVTLSSGETSTWKINCDALSEADLGCLAGLVVERLPAFGAVEGVPTGGDRLAVVLKQSASSGPLLIVDDVLTTGASMERQRAGRKAIGAVLFARGACPAWVTPLFQLSLGGPGAPPLPAVRYLAAENLALRELLSRACMGLSDAADDAANEDDRNHYAAGTREITAALATPSPLADAAWEALDAAMKHSRRKRQGYTGDPDIQADDQVAEEAFDNAVDRFRALLEGRGGEETGGEG